MSISAFVAAVLSLAQPSQPGASIDSAPFLMPAERVEVAPGRALNLVCVGGGTHTVLFDAGGSDWSVVWATTLPKIAPFARVCAYDRAGLGFSDSSSAPRTPFAIVEDLHRLIAARIKRPVVLVGHSLGGFNMKLYAALYPEDVAGLVLVDPAEERVWERTRAWAIGQYGHLVAARSELLDRNFLAGLVERYRNCAAIAKPSGMDPQSVDYRRCSDPPRPALGTELNAQRQKVHATPAFQAAQASEIAFSVYGDGRSDEVYAHFFRPGILGSKPLIVLTHEEPPSTDPIDRLSSQQGLMLHRETARLSRRGQHRLVPDSGHYIQLDQPDKLIEAVKTVLDQLR